MLVSESRSEAAMAWAVKRDARMSVAESRLWLEPRPDKERWEPLDGGDQLRDL